MMLSKKIQSIFFAASILMIPAVGFAQAAATPQNKTTQGQQPFTTDQQQAIQKIIHAYLIEHPEILMEAANALQKKQQAEWQNTASKIVPQIAEPLFTSSVSIQEGNPRGDVTLVEFYDYQCPHCKDMASQIDEIISHDPQLKVILKPLPFFGEASVYAAKAVMASEKQGKALALHQAIMKIPNTLNQDIILKIAGQVGINIQQLQSDMKNPALDNEIKQNNQMAQQLKLTGTPAFIIAKVTVDDKTHKISSLKNTLLIPGAVGKNLLVEAIGDVRGAK
jgi:protein-disulfide isomerase